LLEMVPAVTVKVAVLLEAATVTEAGVVSRLLLSESVTVVLLVAAALRVTVQVLLALEASEVGLHATEVTVMPGAVRLMLAVAVELLRVAVMVAVCAEETVPAVAVKVAVLLEAATVTEAGVVSRLLLSESVTTVLLVGAALKVTVQVLLAPVANEDGEQVTEETVMVAGAVRLMLAVAVMPLMVAVTVAV